MTNTIYKVLLIEDDPSYCDLVVSAAYRSQRPVSIEYKHTLADSLLELSRKRFSGVLCDLRLPDVPDGEGVVKRVADVCGMIPIIVLSGYINDKTYEKCIDEGAIFCLKKTSEPTPLVEVMHTLCERMEQNELADLKMQAALGQWYRERQRLETAVPHVLSKLNS